MAQNFDNDNDRFSYALAMNVSAYLLQLPIQLNREIVMDTVAALLKGGQPEMGQDMYRQTMQQVHAILEQKGNEAKSQASSANKEKGDAYRAENAKSPAVTVTASGLQYEVLREGTGKSPSATNTVKVHYEGTLTDGSVFDSSIKRGEPIEFPLNRVIPGWTEGVQLMKEGAKYRFVIPPELAYGENGAGNAIGPNETLVFEVELIEVK